MSRAATVHKLGYIGSINIWKDCVHYDELTINERQKKDGRFCDILCKVRCGTLTEEILTVLKQHVRYSCSSSSKGASARKIKSGYGNGNQERTRKKEI